MAQVKITKKDMFAQIIEMIGCDTVNQAMVEAGYNCEAIVEFAEHEIELLAKKSGKTGKTKAQKENEVLVELVYEALAEVGKPVTVSEFQAVSELAAGYSNQKLSAMLKKLVDSLRVKKTVEGKKSYFSVPTLVTPDIEVEEDIEESEVEEENEG